MKALFRIRDYRLLWTGQAVSNFGDALTNLALLLTAQRLTDRKSTRLNSSHSQQSRMPSSA